ncbi:DUF1476 domain-containing protein [Flexibacterium corallicola]|uniref:DUF1476 domain-containing protein n=1 Tax=Flexibacterium corallicola TaxID=3037259 RepID=UPI00286F2840|nr:DUF1476 domain-containing protein [Pseudovibrio sp. M1P-2-3]
MTTFDDREKSFEGTFSATEQTRFKAVARRNKLLGLWAAEKLALDTAKTEELTTSLVSAEISHPDGDEVFKIVYESLQAGGVDQSEHQVRRTMDQLLAQAHEELKQNV